MLVRVGVDFVFQSNNNKNKNPHLGRKDLYAPKILGENFFANFFLQKNCLSKKFSRTKFWSKSFFGRKNFVKQNYGSKKYGHKKNLVKEIYGQTFFLLSEWVGFTRMRELGLGGLWLVWLTQMLLLG